MVSIERGVRLGAEEAFRTAALFDLVVEVVSGPDSADPDVTIAAVSQADCRALEPLTRARRLVLVMAGCKSGVAGSGVCGRSTFFLHPSQGSLARARAGLRDSSATRQASTASIALWHPTLQRFGAAQLNERFRRRFGADMESHAWAGWVALKILVEAALRGRSARPDDLARYLRSGARFDGHKGEALSFDPFTGELRQPLYLVEPAVAGGLGRVTRELSTDESFGAAAAAPRCAPT